MTENLSPGTATHDPEAINAILREQFESSGEEQPMRFAGAAPADAAPAPGRPASELKPVEPAPAPKTQAPLPGLPVARPGGAPSWASLPVGIEFPRGRVIYFLKFEAAWTDTPWKGDRQCICWSMSVGDKKIALQRSLGDSLRANDEMIKQTLRAIDGQMVSLENASLDIWWDEIGEKCRGLLQRVFAQLHFLKTEEIDHFLKDCVEARSAG